MLRTVRVILPAFCLLALPVQAATFTVTKTADTLDGSCDRDCSLREAVSAANAAEPEGGADVVVVPAGIYVLTRTGAGEDAGATGDLDLLDQTVLVGAGPGTTILDGFGSDRVLDTYAPVEVYGVTIRNGRVDGPGGGIFVRPNPSPQPVLLRFSIVSGSQAEGGAGADGGGIAAFGVLEVRESAILDNLADGNGGGIGSGDQGTFSLTNVTVSNNIVQGSGGGLDYRVDRGVRISSSTIALNQARVSGGGISGRAPLVPGTFAPQLAASIITINTAPVDTDCTGPASTYGYNVFGIGGSCSLAPTDRTQGPNDARAVIDGITGLLGPTPVHVTSDGSAAVNLVPAEFCEPADQVGQVRSAPCEAGAWEKVVVNPDCVPGGTVLCLQDGRFRVDVRWWTVPHTPGQHAQAVPLTDDTGNFWFFAPENLEVMIKILNGCGLNQRWWAFASGLTDVGFDLEVWDLETGRIWTDHHDQGQTYRPRLDTNAFPCEAPAGLSAAEPAAAEPLAATVLPSAVFAVTKTEDTDDGSCDHDCSLREAVLAANASPGTRVIVIGLGVHTLSLPGGGENGGHAGDLDVTGRLVILGDGAGRTVLDGGGLDRVLDVLSTGSLELHGVTVRNGWSRPDLLHSGAGGGIQSIGPLKLVRSSVTANRSQHNGGGISALELEARDSTVSGNAANTSGGGLVASIVDLENVTVSGNQAGDRAGGVLLYLYGASLRNTTIAGNSASLGGGISVFLDECAGGGPCYGFFEMTGTLIAGNTGNTFPDCWELPQHGGAFTLFGVGNGCNPGLDDQAGTLAQPLDARLTPLGGHGGPTSTHALLPGSPAIDFVPASLCPAVDQRRRLRPADGNLDGAALCDAGAVERLPACQPDEQTLCLGAGDRFQITARWTAQGTNGPGRPVTLALDSGAFWFFDAANLEMNVKVLDGCGLNDRFWVFLSGLTDVGVEVKVVDTATGNTWTHSHAPGTPLQPRLDTNALLCVEP